MDALTDYNCVLDLEFWDINISMWARAHAVKHQFFLIYDYSAFTFGVKRDTNFGLQTSGQQQHYKSPNQWWGHKIPCITLCHPHENLTTLTSITVLMPAGIRTRRLVSSSMRQRNMMKVETQRHITARVDSPTIVSRLRQ